MQRKQGFTSGNSAELCDTPCLGNYNAKNQEPRPMEVLAIWLFVEWSPLEMEFFINWPLEFPHYALSNTPPCLLTSFHPTWIFSGIASQMGMMLATDNNFIAVLCTWFYLHILTNAPHAIN